MGIAMVMGTVMIIFRAKRAKIVGYTYGYGDGYGYVFDQNEGTVMEVR